MKTFFGKIIFLIVVVIVVGAVFIYSGSYNVAAITGHSAPFEWIFRTMTVRSIVSHAQNITPPANFNSQDRELAEHGAGHYEMMCRTCHGAPGKKSDPWQLYPPAPDLVDSMRTMHWSNTEVFWIIKNGIKDTGMSAFGASHGDEDIWALTAFIRQLPTMTAEQYRDATQHAPAKENADHEPSRTSESKKPDDHGSDHK